MLLLLTCCCSAGCAHRNVHFDSYPRGAAVSYDSRQCITPCTLKTDCAAGTAQLNHPLAGQQLVTVEACDVSASIRYHALDTTEKAFKIASAPFAILGIIGLGVIGEDADNGDSTDRDVWLITAGSLLTAGILYGCGEGFGQLKGDLDSEVFVTFPPERTLGNRRTSPPPSAGQPSSASPPPASPLPDSLQLSNESFQRLFSQPEATSQP